MRALFILFALLVLPLCGAEMSTPQQVAFLMQSGQIEPALNLYREHVQQNKVHDYRLLEQIALQLLEKGFHDSDVEVQLLTLYGAGISMHDKVLPLLSEAIRSRNPQIQLVAMHFLARYHNADADDAINHILSSNYLLIRLEGALCLAKKKSRTAVAQAESLMRRVDPQLLPLFPQLFAAAGTAEAMSAMRKLMTNPNELVRISAIICTAESKRDDLLPCIRTLVTHTNHAQQEACAFALGCFKDEASVDKLMRLTKSPSPNVRLAANWALHELGRPSGRAAIEEAALHHDVFAITLLGDIPGTEDLLFRLTQSENQKVRINAAISLLKLKDQRCLKQLCELLIHDTRDLALVTFTSPGKSLVSYKVIPSAKQNLQEIPLALEQSLQLREGLVAKALELPEEAFLRLASVLFEAKQSDLIPELIAGLVSLQSPHAIALLKQQQQRIGVPLIRNYCNLALYQLKEDPMYAEQLKNWVASQRKCDLMSFRAQLPSLTKEKKEKESGYQLTLVETSRLLVDALAAFTESQDASGIDVLLDAIQYGNPKNRYALAGLLIRAAE